MNYQAICAAIETPFNNAFRGLNPAVKIYFDNVIAVPPDAPGEYVMVNITFGLTTRTSLTSSLDSARGAIVVRIFTAKNAGGLRSRQLSGVAKCVLDSLANTKKTSSGIFLRARDVSGPAFSMDNAEPHFMARLGATWEASDLG